MSTPEDEIDCQEKIKQRIATLKKEFEAGQKILIELEAKKNEIKTTLLRIDGAVRVLEEF